MTTVQQVITLMEQLAPRSYAESWDNVGLMVGDRNAIVTGVLTTLDVTAEAILYAIEHDCNLIVSHHPLIFKGLKQLSCDTARSRRKRASGCSPSATTRDRGSCSACAPHGTYPHKSAKAQRFSTAFPTAVQNALTGCLNVSAFVVFFTVLARLLLHFLPEAFASSLPCALLLGFLELTSGVLALPCSRAGFLSCAALLGWGGLSVHCQTLSVLAASPLSARYYLKGKVLQALLSLLLALPALPALFP